MDYAPAKGHTSKNVKVAKLLDVFFKRKVGHKSRWIENGGSVYLGGVKVRSKYDQNTLYEILNRLINRRKKKKLSCQAMLFYLTFLLPGKHSSSFSMFFLKGHFVFEGISLAINPTICEHIFTSLCNSFLQAWITSKANHLPACHRAALRGPAQPPSWKAHYLVEERDKRQDYKYHCRENEVLWESMAL